MPTCRECHSRISKFDKDICPVCGCKKPLEGVTSETVEITSQIDLNGADYQEYKPKRRTVLFFLSMLLGFFGAPFIYLGKKLFGILSLIINFAFIGGVGTIFALFTPLGYSLGYVIALIIIFVINTVVGLFFLFKNSIKDSKGEFVK